MEEDTPRVSAEYNSSKEAWSEIGLRIKWTSPEIPGQSEVHMLDPLELRVCVECKKPVPLRDLSAFAWTSFFHTDNPEGIFCEIALGYDEKSRKWDDWGLTTYEFAKKVYPTHHSVFPLTFYVKFEDKILWASKFEVDHSLKVLPSREINEWTKKETNVQITKKFFMGNHLAVLIAEDMGYDAVLNLHKISGMSREELPLVKCFTSADIEPGAGFVLPEPVVQRIVEWLSKARVKYKKILVGDHDGQGRIGTSMTAYIFANNPNLSFQEAYDFVRSRKFCYCHQGLKDALCKLYPRD